MNHGADLLELTFYTSSLTLTSRCKKGGRMKISTKGQVTIPQELREKLGLLPNTEVEFELDGNTLRLKKAKAKSTRGKELVEHLRNFSKAVEMSTEDLMAMTRESKR